MDWFFTVPQKSKYIMTSLVTGPSQKRLRTGTGPDLKALAARLPVISYEDELLEGWDDV